MSETNKTTIEAINRRICAFDTSAVLETLASEVEYTAVNMQHEIEKEQIENHRQLALELRMLACKFFDLGD